MTVSGSIPKHCPPHPGGMPTSIHRMLPPIPTTPKMTLEERNIVYQVDEAIRQYNPANHTSQPTIPIPPMPTKVSTLLKSFDPTASVPVPDATPAAPDPTTSLSDAAPTSMPAPSTSLVDPFPADPVGALPRVSPPTSTPSTLSTLTPLSTSAQALSAPTGGVAPDTYQSQIDLLQGTTNLATQIVLASANASLASQNNLSPSRKVSKGENLARAMVSLMPDRSNIPPPQRLKRAIQTIYDESSIDIYEHFVRMAYSHPAVLISLMNKVLPNKQSVTLEPNDIEEFKKAFLTIFQKHVKDPNQLEAIATDLANLTSKHSGGGLHL